MKCRLTKENESMTDYKTMIDHALESYVNDPNVSYHTLTDSMRYSLLAGGKRLRPILLLEFCRISGGDVEKALPVACAIEMIHTYSLIHDDLPCMDNDDLRRGKPTNHIVYGECTATLAGDALQAEAFRSVLSADLPADRKAACALYLSEASGVNGICGGQILDIEGEGSILTTKQLDEINRLKTSALLIAACKMGVASAGGTELQLRAAEQFGRYLGLAFQIRDDVLDVLSTEEELGKPIGSDQEEGKNTYMALLGQEQCEQKISELTLCAKHTLTSNFEDCDYLLDLADSMAIRRN